MKKLLVSLLILGTTALYFGQTVTTAVFTDVVNFTGNGTNNLFQTDAILPPGSPTNIASWTATGSSATVTTSGNHYLSAGDTVVIAGTTSIDGTWTVSGVTPTTFSFAAAISGSGAVGGTVTRPVTAKVETDSGGKVDITSVQTPSTFATGHRIYRAPATPFSTITTSSTAVGGYSTITTSAAHRLSAGDTVVITGHSMSTGSSPALNGRYTVYDVPTATTFRIAVNVTGGTGGTGGLVYRVDPVISVSSGAGANPTITSAQPHGLSTGDIVTLSGLAGTTVPNGIYAVTYLTAITFQITSATSFTAGTGGQAFKNVAQQTILTSSVAVGGLTTVTTAGAHGLTAGASVWIKGHTGSTPAINGAYTVSTVPSATTFTLSVAVTAGGTGGSLVRAMTSAISASSATNPTTITTPAAHGLVTGDTVFIDGHSGGTTVPVSISSASPAVVTGTTGVAQGQQVTISGTGPAFDGTWTATVVDSSHFTIPTSGTAAAGFATNAIYGSYTVTVVAATTFTIPAQGGGTGGQFYRVPKANIVSSSASTVTAITTTAPSGSNTIVNTSTAHGLGNGQTVFISGNSNSSVNGTWVVSGASSTQFTIAANTTGSGAGTGGSVSTGTTITTAVPHRLVANDKIFVADHTGSTPPIAGQYTVVAAPTASTLLLNVNITTAGAGGTASGPWSQVGADISPLAKVSYVDTSPLQGVSFYTVRGYYSGQGAIWESPNSNVVGASILNDFNVIMPNPVSTTFSVPAAGNPVSLQVPSTAGFLSGDAVTVTITNAGTTTPTVTGHWTATVVDGTHMTIPLNVTGVSGGPTGTVERGPTVAISSSSAGNATIITTGAAHNLGSNGTVVPVTIYGHTSTPDINGQWLATVTGTSTFTIPTSVDVAGTGGHIGDFDQTAGTTYSVTARARSADGATLLPFTGASTLSVTSGQPGTLACTPACASQKPTAGVLTFTEKITDAPTATTSLHVASDTVPSRAGDGKAFNVAPASYFVGDTVNITSNSAANPTSVLTSAAHGLSTGNTVVIRGSNSTPSIDGAWTVTVVDTTHFTVPVAVSGIGSAGIVVTPIGQQKSGTGFSMGAAALDSSGALLKTFTGSPTLGPSLSPPATTAATITCTSSCTQAAVAGVATYTGTVTNAPWATMLQATYTSGMLTPLGNTAGFTVGPTSFTLNTPAMQTKDVAFSTLTATAKDSTGVTATTFVGSVTVAPSVGICTAGCTATASAGVATFTGLTLNTGSNAMTLTATYTGAPTNSTGTSAAFRVNGKSYFSSSSVLVGNSAGSGTGSCTNQNGLVLTTPTSAVLTLAATRYHVWVDSGSTGLTSLDAGSYTVTVFGRMGSGTTQNLPVAIGTCSTAGVFTAASTAGPTVSITTTAGARTSTTITVGTTTALSSSAKLAVQVRNSSAATLIVTMDGTSFVTGPVH